MCNMFAFPLFCNKCFRLKDSRPTLEFYILRCGHIVCTDCRYVYCLVCSHPNNPILIDKNLPPKLAVYFESTLKACERFQKIMKFHRDQNTLFIHHFTQIQNDREKIIYKRHHGINKLDAKLSADVDNEKKRIEKIKKYLEYLDHRKKTSDVPKVSINPLQQHKQRCMSFDDKHANGSSETPSKNNILNMQRPSTELSSSTRVQTINLIETSSESNNETLKKKKHFDSLSDILKQENRNYKI